MNKHTEWSKKRYPCFIFAITSKFLVLTASEKWLQSVYVYRKHVRRYGLIIPSYVFPVRHEATKNLTNTIYSSYHFTICIATYISRCRQILFVLNPPPQKNRYIPLHPQTCGWLPRPIPVWYSEVITRLFPYRPVYQARASIISPRR